MPGPPSLGPWYVYGRRRAWAERQRSFQRSLPRMKPILLFAIALSLGVNAFPQNNDAASPLVDRVGQTGFLQLEADSFNSLPPKQKALAFWLSMAAIAVNPIVYDQNSSYGLELKHLLEQILTHSKGIDPEVLKKITDYTKLYWANRGNHNSFTSEKFLPDFTPEELD